MVTETHWSNAVTHQGIAGTDSYQDTQQKRHETASPLRPQMKQEPTMAFIPSIWPPELRKKNLYF